MPESKLTATRSVLLLENSLVAATQLRELLSALPGWHLDTTVHLSDAGIFPTSSDLHDLVLVADDYAHLNLSQIIEVAKCYQPHAHIVVLGTTLADARSPQQFVAAGRAGVNYWLQKDNISLVTLNSMLQQLFNDGDQPARLVNPATEAKPAPASPAAGVNLATEHNAGLATQADSILAEIPVGIIIFGVADDDFIYRRINRAAAESTQLKAQQLIGQRLRNDAVNFENFNLRDALRQMRTNPTAQTHRVMRLADDATASWREIVIQQLQGGDLLVAIHDISERVQLAAKRRYDEKIWWHIAKSLPDLCAVVDESGAVNQVIAGDWQQLNIDSNTLPGQPITAMLAPDEREQCNAGIRKALNTGKTQTAVYTLDIPENQIRLHVKIALLRAEVNAPRQVLWLARDINGNGNHTAALTAAGIHSSTPDLLNEMLQRAPFMAAISNADGRYEQVNTACTQRLQQAAEAVIGKTDGELFAAEIAQQLQHLDQKLLTEGIAQQSDIALPNDCEMQPFRVIKIPLNGTNLATQSIVTLALPLATGADKTKPMAGDPSRRQAAAQPESIDDLVGDIARDFNDVLVNLTEHTRLALDNSTGEPGSEITSYLSAVMNSSQRARELVTQMMAYQTTDASSAATRAADLTLFVSGIVELLRNTIGQHLQITSDLQPNLQVQEIDSLRLQNAFIQLFRVAQQSFDASGHLSVCLRSVTQQDHECAYCYAHVRGDFVVVSLHSSARSNADVIENQSLSAELPQDEALLSQIKRVHELLQPYSGHILLRGAAGEEQSWYVFLATDPASEYSLKIVPQPGAITSD